MVNTHGNQPVKDPGMRSQTAEFPDTLPAINPNELIIQIRIERQLRVQDVFSKQILLVTISVVSMTLGGCASYRPAPAAFNEAINKPYMLDAGDRIRLTVFEQEGITNTYSVDQAGYISVPLIGSVPARGKTIQQIEADVAARLRKGYLRDPDVAVEIDRYRPVFVMGEVGAAGQYSYVPGMTAQKAIAAAGGFTPRANQGDVDITRQFNGESLTGRVIISDQVLPGDTIYVRERFF
ncbi:polysaccharide export outer membrane protein [Phyllobacterium brassicacearum]|nr:polysaccharide export outer membrane protein [Phyllobacterium brassicacearum]